MSEPRYRRSSVPASDSSVFIACTECGVLVWDTDTHERVAHADAPESAHPERVPAQLWPGEGLRAPVVTNERDNALRPEGGRGLADLD